MVLAEFGVFMSIVMCVVLSIVYFYHKQFKFWHNNEVFYVKPIFPFGNIKTIIFGKVPTGIFFQELYRKYKNHRLFGIYTFYTPNLVVADPEIIHIVLVKEFESFCDRGFYSNEKIDPLSEHLFLMSGKKWRNMRGKLTPTFTTGKIRQMFLLMKECCQILTDYLESKAQQRESVEIKDILSRYTTDVIMSTAFGIKSDCIMDPNNEYRTQGKKILKANPIKVALFMFAPQILNFFSIPLTAKSVTNFYMDIFRQNVEYRQTNNVVKNDFMQLLINLMEEDYDDPYNRATKKKLSMVEATAQSYVFFIAGFETSSATATFALYELAQNLEIQEKLYQEINQAKYDELTYDDINDMIYLDKVINETLRKYPPLTQLNRICTKDINLSTTKTTKIHISRDTLITIPVLGLHRDSDIYPDPDKFDPERFNKDEIKKRHQYAFLPFGEGQRNCIGARFGQLQVKVALVYLLKKYKFKSYFRTPRPITFSTKCIGLGIKGGIPLQIEKR